jgi:subtilisin-like proprotein convertase family protein
MSMISGWKFSSVRFWGEHQVNGVWQIIVEDKNPRTTGRGHFNGYELIVYGY